MPGNKRIFDQIDGSKDDAEHEVTALGADADSVRGQNMTTGPTATHPEATSENQNAENETDADSSNADVPMEQGGPTNAGTEELAGSSNDKNRIAEKIKQPRKRRKKGDPEPDYTATAIEKSKKLKRVAQACTRCHVFKFRCDNGSQGCYSCLSKGKPCVMIDRVTKKPYLRGGGDGVVVHFEDIQDENTDLKAKNEQLNQENEQLRAENNDLRVQAQYFQSLTSIGATSAPTHVPVSLSYGNPLSPQTQAISQPYPNYHNTQPQPVASNYNLNSNAFSGNMEIGRFTNSPNTLPENTVPFPQWAQPNIPVHTAASQNTMITYPSNFSQVPVQSALFQAAPVQNANNQGMGYPARPWQNFQGPCVQVPGAQQRLPQPQPTGNQQPNVQNRNPPTQSLQHPPMPLPYQYPNTDGQNQNKRAVQVPSSTVVPAQQQRNQLQLGNTVQNPGRQLPPNQNPQPQNVSMTTQYQGNHKVSNMNAQNQGMQILRPPNHSFQEQNVQVRNTGTQNQGSQHQSLQPQNANTQNRNIPTATQQHQTRANPSNNVQNPSTTNQNPKQQSQSQPQNIQVEQSQHQNTEPQNPEPKKISSNMQDLTLPDTGPTQLPNTILEKSNNTGGLDGTSDHNIQKILDGFSWISPSQAGGQYLFDDIMADTSDTTATTQGQQVDENIGGNNALPDTAVDFQPQRSSIDALFLDIDDRGIDDWQNETDININVNPNPNRNRSPKTAEQGQNPTNQDNNESSLSYSHYPASQGPPPPSGEDGTSEIF